MKVSRSKYKIKPINYKYLSEAVKWPKTSKITYFTLYDECEGPTKFVAFKRISENNNSPWRITSYSNGKGPFLKYRRKDPRICKAWTLVLDATKQLTTIYWFNRHELICVKFSCLSEFHRLSTHTQPVTIRQKQATAHIQKATAWKQNTRKSNPKLSRAF